MPVYPANYCQSNQLEPGKNRASFRVEIKRHENSSKEADPDQQSTWEGKAGSAGSRKCAGMVFPCGQVDFFFFPPGLDFPQHPSGRSWGVWESQAELLRAWMFLVLSGEKE